MPGSISVDLNPQCFCTLLVNQCSFQKTQNWGHWTPVRKESRGHVECATQTGPDLNIFSTDYPMVDKGYLICVIKKYIKC